MNNHETSIVSRQTISSKDVIKFTGPAIVLTALTACGVDPFYEGSDEYYRNNDPSVAKAMALADQKAVAAETQSNTAQTAKQKSFETGQSQTTPLTNDIILCARVEPGGSVSQAVEDANNGVFPPYDFNGLSLQVLIDNNGQRTIEGLEKIMTTGNGPIVNPGDQVCISTNPAKLQQRPTLTP